MIHILFSYQLMRAENRLLSTYEYSYRCNDNQYWLHITKSLIALVCRYTLHLIIMTTPGVPSISVKL